MKDIGKRVERDVIEYCKLANIKIVNGKIQNDKAKEVSQFINDRIGKYRNEPTEDYRIKNPLDLIIKKFNNNP